MNYFSPHHSPYQGTNTMDEDQELNQFFENYIPLSNLPTPPLSAATTPADEFIHISPSILAPAIHLAKLIPASASRTRLSPDILAEYIARAQLSFETLGFAACVLDSLSSSFIRAWRAAIIQASSGPTSTTSVSSNTSAKRSSTHRPARSSWGSASYQWKPELIALAALQLSSSFVDDVCSSARWWADAVAGGAVLTLELDATVRVMLKDLGYDLCAFRPEDVQHMMRAMQRGIAHCESRREQHSPSSDGYDGVY